MVKMVSRTIPNCTPSFLTFLVGFLLQVSAVSLVERRIDGSDFLRLFLPKEMKAWPERGGGKSVKNYSAHAR